MCMFRTYSYGGHNNQLGYYDIYFVDADNTYSTIQGIMTCEPIQGIDIIWHCLILSILFLELVILKFKYWKGHTEVLGNLQ